MTAAFAHVLEADEIIPPRTASATSRASLADLDRLARLLDARWRIPGLNLRFGVESLVGLVPGLGDAAGGLLSAYIIVRAAGHGAPSSLLARMAANVAIDTAVGAVPVVGALFDVYFKANMRNMRLLREHLEAHGHG